MRLKHILRVWQNLTYDFTAVTRALFIHEVSQSFYDHINSGSCCHLCSFAGDIRGLSPDPGSGPSWPGKHRFITIYQSKIPPMLLQRACQPYLLDTADCEDTYGSQHAFWQAAMQMRQGKRGNPFGRSYHPCCKRNIAATGGAE